MSSNSYFQGKTRNTTWAVMVFSLIIFVSQLPNYYGEDIVNARQNYLTGAKTDFWGGISTLIYSSIPNVGFRWQISLAIIQLAMAAMGLRLLVAEFSVCRHTKVAQLIVIYTSLIFSIQMTRDGLMFSFLILGLGLLNSFNRHNHGIIWSIPGITLVIIGMSFRPWLSVAIIPIVLYILGHSKTTLTKVAAVTIALSLLIAPIAAELASSKVLQLKRSYPEQQVMIMDAAASYCFTNNISTGNKAREILGIFTPSDNFSKNVCQFFRADTWLSLTASKNASSEGLNSDFWIIPAGASEEYEQLRKKWIELVTADPVTYIQNKIVFFTRLAIGSDSRNFSFLLTGKKTEFLSGVVKLPYDIFIFFHLLSILSIISILITVSISSSVRAKLGFVKFQNKTLVLVLSLILWTICSAIAYIGSNGRYTYAISLIAAIIAVSNSRNKKLLG